MTNGLESTKGRTRYHTCILYTEHHVLYGGNCANARRHIAAPAEHCLLGLDNNVERSKQSCYLVAGAVSDPTAQYHCHACVQQRTNSYHCVSSFWMQKNFDPLSLAERKPRFTAGVWWMKKRRTLVDGGPIRLHNEESEGHQLWLKESK